MFGTASLVSAPLDPIDATTPEEQDLQTTTRVFFTSEECNVYSFESLSISTSHFGEARRGGDLLPGENISPKSIESIKTHKAYPTRDYARAFAVDFEVSLPRYSR